METILTITNIVIGKQNVDNLHKRVFDRDYIYSPLGYNNGKLIGVSHKSSLRQNPLKKQTGKNLKKLKQAHKYEKNWNEYKIDLINPHCLNIFEMINLRSLKKKKTRQVEYDHSSEHDRRHQFHHFEWNAPIVVWGKVWQ